MTPSPTVEEVSGYTVTSADLSPFRAGQVWHYSNVGYLVTSCVFSEKVGQRVTRSLAGAVLGVQVGFNGPTEVRMDLERADWADPLPMVRRLDGFDQRGVRYLFEAGGQCWVVSQFNALIFGVGTGRLFIRDAHWGGPSYPDRLEVVLWRDPTKDT